MSALEWRIAFASVAGTSHAARGISCQDASDCQVLRRADGAPILVAVVADGAGSASHADLGASLACSGLVEVVAAFYDEGHALGDLASEVAAGWALDLANAALGLAEAEGLAARDLASTLLAAVVEPERAAFLQIGDGAIVVARRSAPDAFAPVVWPRRGEYVNQTHFLTDLDALDHLTVALVDEPVDEVALLSDGLQGLALHEASRTAHAPFFRPIFAPVRVEPAGCSERLSAALARFLDSPRVNRRTDDDKTLVLATRRPAPAGNARPEAAPVEAAG